MNWNPIETAPKNGEFILVFRNSMPPAVVRWSKKQECWLGVDTSSESLSTPTHWALLPDAPMAA